MVAALRKVLLLVLPVIVLAGPARAQADAEITAVLDRWAATYGSATSGAEMLPLYHPEAVFFGTAFREPFVGRDSFVPYFQQQFDNFPTRALAFEDMVIVLVTPDVATATGLYRFDVATANGQRAQALYRVTFALIRTAEGFQIIQHHSSMLPQ
ncbi:MAG: nuclear transport factor 2 family protein [Bauldia sp.]|nr:nuclear transport factor 2 family protein [Bauldia sp.]